MDFLTKLMKVIDLTDHEDNKNGTCINLGVLLINCASLGKDDCSLITKYLNEGKVLILDVNGYTNPANGIEMFELMCKAVRKAGGYMRPMGSEFFIALPKDVNYTVVTRCPENYRPEERRNVEYWLS